MIDKADLKINLNRDIADFAADLNLSQRETDVFLLLLNRVATSANIAKLLGLSANTISNHLKSILAKSRCHSKTELLGMFLQYQFERNASLQIFTRRPRTLIINHVNKDLRALVEGLGHRGIESKVCKPEDAVGVFTDGRFQTILNVCQKQTHEIFDQISLFRKVGRDFSYFLMMDDFNFDPTGMREHGVAEALTFKLTPDQVAMAIIEHFIEDPYVRNRFVRADIQFETVVNNKFKGRTENIGHGGLFISFNDSKGIQRHMKQNKKIEVGFTLPYDNKYYEVYGRVAWIRSNPRSFQDFGFGVEFLDMDRESAQVIKEFVRQQKAFPRL